MNQIISTREPVESKLRQLEDYLESLGPTAIAVSGGVDSMTLAIVACRIYPDSEVFHAVSAAVPPKATQRVREWGEKEGWFLHVIQAGEMSDPDYLANPTNRCYYCKTSLYKSIWQETTLPVISGTNSDDLNDFRPGLEAAENFDVTHPYVAVGIDKRTVRGIAKLLNLDDLHELPAAPCLSSRITTGIAIDQTLLPLINATEEQIWHSLGNDIQLTSVRCRIRKNAAVIELETDDWEKIREKEFDLRIREIVEDIFTSGDYTEYCESVSIEPYRMGSAFVRADIPAENRIPARTED